MPGAPDLPELLADLADETGSLLAMLDGLAPADWERPTTAEGWAVRDQVSHLAFFDDAIVEAAGDPAAFERSAAELVGGGADFPDRVAEDHRSVAPAELLAWFRDSRRALIGSLGRLDARHRLPWYGTTMSVTSAVTARLMETWAHGEDVAEALSVRRAPTARLRHVAHLGVATLGFSFTGHRQPVPSAPVRVELDGPAGERWSWGDEAAGDRVAGPALDFCLVVTQRRPVAATALEVDGEVAHRWMAIAQAFAGPPTTVRRAGGRP